MLRKTLIATLFTAFAAASAQADVVTQWNFNSSPADSSTSTGTTVASIGSGAAATIGGVTASFASGSASGGSSDPAPLDNSGWQTTGYTAQGTMNKSAGVQFNVSTLGFRNIVIGYDLRHSNTSSRYEQVQYSLDGINFTDIAGFDGNAGDTWFNGRSIDLSSILGANDNASFAFRIVSAFAPGSSAYAASASDKSYAATGTWRFDMVTVSAMPVPEPGTYALFLAGFGLMGTVIRRRSRD